jgi:hypothetical protein
VTNHLVHYEPSVDADSWARREERFTKKFAMGRQHAPDIPQLSFLTQEQVDSMEQIAVSNAFPEQYPMLRTLQFALCGYYRVVSP